MLCLLDAVLAVVHAVVHAVVEAPEGTAAPQPAAAALLDSVAVHAPVVDTSARRERSVDRCPG